jgi:DNA-binding transcriptional LysR family regulator
MNKASNPPSLAQTLTPDALALLETIAAEGSFAAAARAMGLVPSALTYRVRLIEDALDVLLFDRSARTAVLTPAGQELLREGQRLLRELDAVAHRVKRVATGWEPQFTVAVDSIMCMTTVMELAQDFFALGAPTRLKLREEALSGTLAALTSGQADLAIGVVLDASDHASLQHRALGQVPWAFVVAPHHSLADAPEPLADELISQHRAVAVADSVQHGRGLSVGLLGGQDVFTVPSISAKLQAQLRGLGCGFLPEALVTPYLESGRLVRKTVRRQNRVSRVCYAWTSQSAVGQGKALAWWLKALESPKTRQALLGI